MMIAVLPRTSPMTPSVSLELSLPSAPLLDERDRAADHVGEVPRPLGEAEVGRDDHRVDQLHRPEVVGQREHRRQLVDRDAEEALDLAGVQVHRQDAVGAGHLEQVGQQARRDRDARLVLLVGAAVGEVRDDGRDAAGRGPLERVEHDEQLHHALVDRRAGRLHDEDVVLAHVLVDLDEDVLVAELEDLGLAERHAQVRTDVPRELWMRVAREDRELAVQDPSLPKEAESFARHRTEDTTAYRPIPLTTARHR